MESQILFWISRLQESEKHNREMKNDGGEKLIALKKLPETAAVKPPV